MLKKMLILAALSFLVATPAVAEIARFQYVSAKKDNDTQYFSYQCDNGQVVAMEQRLNRQTMSEEVRFPGIVNADTWFTQISNRHAFEEFVNRACYNSALRQASN